MIVPHDSDNFGFYELPDEDQIRNNKEIERFYSLHKNAKKMVRRLFGPIPKNADPKEIEKEREELLYSFGATLIYWLINHPEVKGLQVGSVATHKIAEVKEDRLSSVINRLNDMTKIWIESGKDKSSDSLTPEDRIFLQEYEQVTEEMKKAQEESDKVNKAREMELAERVMKFFDENPGETVIVTFGASHNFCDDFNRFRKKPLLKSIMYPRLNAEAGYSAVEDEILKVCR
jgi:hypothetical protein